MNREKEQISALASVLRLAGQVLLIATVVCSSMALAQQSQPLPEAPKPQKNAPPPPAELPAPATPDSAAPAQAPTPAPGMENAPLPTSETGQQSPETPPSPPPPANVQTMPAGSQPGPDSGSREELATFSQTVNFVTVPVTVKDRDGHLVEGLLSNNFSIYEEGVKQNVKFFTSDPFPLSAAVVIDMGMSDTEVSKIRQTLPALIGAFGQFDEISIYTYGNTVKKWQDLTAADKVSSSSLRQLRAQRGGASGAPVVGGPLGQSGPIINGRKMDNTPNIESLPSGQITPSRVLNDAIMMAAQDLAAKDRLRRAQSPTATVYRKILFVISDGRELGSATSYADVMKVLLSNDIAVYAIGVGGAALPVYGKLDRLSLPKFSPGNILPKYTSATGGQVFPEFTQDAIEAAYSRVTGDARNQYTLGYTTRATPSTSYRTIEVKVNRPGLKIYARDGYYPLPPERRGSKR